MSPTLGLIDDPVSQKTSIQNYSSNSDLMFQHAYFDISFNDGGELVQADNYATYQLSRKSSRSYNYFQYLKTFHTNHTVVKTYPSIDLEGYLVYGMCQKEGDLDYVIALHQNTNEIRVLRLTYDPARLLASINDYKVLDKDPLLKLTGDLFVDCKYREDYRGVNTYVIGVLGSYMHPNSIISYYFAKFSTKYNMTEYFIKSEDPNVMEIPRRVRVDIDNQRIYIAIEINKNKYLGRTVYTPGDPPGQDNSNVAVIGYSWNYGTRLWTSVVGNKYYMDSIADMEIYGNNVYILTNSFSTQYSTNSSQTDIYYYRLRSENGYIENFQIFGSPSDDKALDLVTNYNGLYVLALINSPFLPHKDSDKQWKTQNSKQNIAIIQFDFQDSILEIEGYDLSLSTTIKPYPIGLFVKRQPNSQKQTFILYAHRSNNEVDKKGGLFLTYLSTQDAIFSQNTSCGSGCFRCSSKKNTKCLECQAGYFLYKHACYSSSCPQYSFQYYDEVGVPQTYCKDCHYSCKDCIGPRDDQCSSCCTNGICGPIYDRTPNLGKCTCPTTKKESNGICGTQCQLNLGATVTDRCYSQCPSNSYPDLVYDALVAQERTEYDPGSASMCELYTNHLKFNKVGKGLRVTAANDLEEMPKEFTIGFWVAPTALNTESYFMNLFGRALLYTQTTNKYIYYKFINGVSTNVQPTYTPANQVISLTSWNYITVSQREIVTSGALTYEIQLGLSTNNFGTLLSAGYSSSQPVLKYGAFTNTIYLGAYSDDQPQSFTGYLKEVRLFTKYHGIAQMADEAIRLYRLYSYDDPYLVSYWKLTEGYSSTDIEYRIQDYSMNQNTITYSILSKPDYPVYTSDIVKPLSLCYFHDVKTCRTLNYKSMFPFASTNQQYIQQATLLTDSTLTMKKGDQLQFLPNNTDCSRGDQVLAKINYTNSVLGWEVKDEAFNPMYLKEGTHYQLCYYISNLNVVYNMAQLYMAFKPRTVDPSTAHIYNRTDNNQQWMTGWGDQAYGDVIRFSYDCKQPIVNETEMMRSNSPSYNKLIILQDFNVTGDFYFCWSPVFMQDHQTYPTYSPIHDLRFKVQYEPTLKGTFKTTASVNEDVFLPALSGTFVEGDQFTMTWKGETYSDCNPINILGTVYTYNHSFWPAVWMGYNSGIHGINQTKMDEIQACWKPGADAAPNVYIRVKKEDLSPYFMRIFNFDTLSNQRTPELVSFDPIYGSASLIESDRQIKFNFNSQQVIPCSDGTTPGKIVIYRGAVKSDGSYTKTNQILWSNNNLNESTTPDPFQQGDLLCTQTGQCSIILGQDINRMKPGEVYFLTFYSYSFLSYYGSTKYYLFNNAYPVGTAVYDHLFMCRSYDIYTNDALVNGNIFTISGLDLKQKVIKAKYQGGSILSDTFYTKAINIRFKVYNTDQYFCTFNRPTATISMDDVTNTSITIRNLELRQCNDGKLFAEYIEVVRGIRDKYGQFSYLRSEKMYNILLGTVGCHSSCSVCNGTSENNCQICTSSNNFLLNGKCYSKCPKEAPFISTYTITFQNLLKDQKTCVSSCAYGQYSDPETNVCVACNSDCQTCNSSIIASCLSCNPVKQLFNGICVQDCPLPHHQNNYTSYECNQLSDTLYLKVKIQSLGYINRIPKDKTIYLKSDINNTNGGNITYILWEQLEPDLSSAPDINIFSSDIDGTHDTSSPIVRLNNNGLMKISVTQVVKVKLTVMNSLSEVAYDIYEFFLNDSPFIGDLSITKVNDDTNNTGSSIDTLYQVDLNKWYDSPDDTIQKLKLKVYAIKTYRVGQSIQSQQYTLTDQLSLNTLFVTLPAFSVDWKLINLLQANDVAVPNSLFQNNISVCVLAEDAYQAIGSKCKDLNNVPTKQEFTSNYSKVCSYINNIDLMTNMSNILLTSNIIYQAIQQPLRLNSQDSICTLDFHCNYRGICTGKLGIQKCECNQGYFGTYCDFQGNELQNLRNIVSKIVSQVNTIMKSRFVIKPFDIEAIANVVRAVTNQPDLVDDETFNSIIELLEIISNASIYAHKPLDQNTTAIVMDAYGNSLVKINHSFKKRRAMKDTLLLGMGLNLQQFTNSFQLSSNPANLQSILKQQYFLNDDQKPYLIGGISSPRKSKKYLSEAELTLYEEWGRRVDKSFDNFILHQMNKLDPLNNILTSRTKAFDLMLQHKKTTTFFGKTYIKSKDAYWNFPTSMWDNLQGVASKKHELRQKLVKHIMNPYKFEKDPGVFLESNITTVEYYSLGNSKIPVKLSGNSYIDYREPYNQSLGYSSEFLRCMAWNEQQNRFDNDNTCTYQKIWEVIPCSDCDQYNQINTTVSICRCKHLSRFGVVYERSNKTQSKGGNYPGIYSDFFAMKYWTSSFGYLASLAGLSCFIAGHIFIWFFDRRLQQNLIVKLREKIRRFELQYGAMMLRKDGLFFRQEQLMGKKGGKIASKKKVYLKQNQDDVQGLMDQNGQPIKQHEEFKEGDEKPKKKVANRKVFQDEVNNNPDVYDTINESDYSQHPIKEQDAYKDFNKKKKRRGGHKEKFKVGDNFDENDRIIMRRLEQEKKRKQMKKFLEENDEEIQKDISKMTPLQRAQYEKHQKIVNSLKKEIPPPQLYHAFMGIRYDDIDGMTKKEFRRRIMIHVKRLPKEFIDGVKDYLSELRGQLNSTDEEMYLNMQDIFIEERERRELNNFKLKNMVISGSFFLSLFFVTSLLSPRHIRWSLFFCNVVMLWFICAVFFNNTKDPLAVPDFVNSLPLIYLQTTNASSLAIKDIWISFVAPWGSTILMYIVASFLKMPNSQLLNVVTLRQLEASIIEFRKESGVRFLMGYLIVFVIMGTIFWYVITFTATFGWKISWVWWYAGIAAIIIQFAFVDPLFSIANYYLFKAHRKSGILCLRIRSVTQGYNELFEISDNEKAKIHARKTTDQKAITNPPIDVENPPAQPVGQFMEINQNDSAGGASSDKTKSGVEGSTSNDQYDNKKKKASHVKSGKKVKAH